MAYLPKILVAAGIALAMAFTFSCSDDGGGDDTPSSSSGPDLSSSSSDTASSSSSDVETSSSSDTSSSSSGNDSSSSVDSQSSSSVDDGAVVYGDPVTHGDETYQTVVIGTQTWFARNLNYDPGKGYSLCYGDYSGDDSEGNCVTYGRLYNWTTAMDLEQDCLFNTCSDDIHPNHQGICPEGWHIPSLADWNTLIEYAGGSSEAGAKLKAAIGWYGDRNGTDDYGFSALSGGGVVGDNFAGLGNYSFWWLPSEDYGDGEYWTINHDGEVYADIHYKTNYYSVRCVKNLFVIDW